MKTFEKVYDGESIYDLPRDIMESFDEGFNPIMSKVPADEHGIQQGSFRVTVEWSPQ